MPLPLPWLNRHATLVGAGLIACGVIAVYANTLSVPFLFDDQAAVVHNATIRDLGDLGRVFSPPGDGVTVQGRPVLNLSLAVNYALGALSLRGFHLGNLLIHLGGAWVLFGIVRRTLALAYPASTPKGLSEGEATWLGLAVALLWAVHPLQTESVTYVIQRAESLMGLFYLLTLYCFIRSAQAASRERTGGWQLAAWLACLAGMATKEVMVSAPLVILAYDALLISGSVAAALRKRWGFYVSLLATELVLGWLVTHTGNRGGTAGFGIEVGLLTYWATQFQAIAYYLYLCFWPDPLIFDYGVQWVSGPIEVLPYLVVVTVALAGTLWALWRRRPEAVAGLVFFAVLAPTSLVPGNRQTLAEHRLYLPLAAVLAVAVVGGYRLLGTQRRRNAGWFSLVVGGITVALTLAAIRRNETYRSELALDQDTAQKRPGNPAAHLNLGNVLRDRRQFDEAIGQYATALQLRPSYYQAHYDMGIALAQEDRSIAALAEYEAALKLKPDYPEAQNNLGILLARGGRDSDAVGHLREAVRLNPEAVDARFNLGLVLARSGQLEAGVAQLQEVLRINPGYYPAEMTLAYAYQAMGRQAEAAVHFAAAQRLQARPSS